MNCWSSASSSITPLSMMFTRRGSDARSRVSTSCSTSLVASSPPCAGVITERQSRASCALLRARARDSRWRSTESEGSKGSGSGGTEASVRSTTDDRATGSRGSAEGRPVASHDVARLRPSAGVLPAAPATSSSSSSSSSSASFSSLGMDEYPGRNPNVHRLVRALSSVWAPSTSGRVCTKTGRSRSPAPEVPAEGAPSAAPRGGGEAAEPSPPFGGGVAMGAAVPSSWRGNVIPWPRSELYVSRNCGWPSTWKASAQDSMSMSAFSATSPVPLARRTMSAWNSLVATRSWKSVSQFFMQVSSTVSASTATFGLR
mmetsp:Transcript_11540/g.39397  ORF Transcript_11540/g.39397 Transcript_11540/m.39397 type:complete len:315 (+) Transcript_11540:947-1891(+)